jgi:hypothetical protein
MDWISYLESKTSETDKKLLKWIANLQGLFYCALYCAFTTPIRKLLIFDGAGEGNRTLVLNNRPVSHLDYQPFAPRRMALRSAIVVTFVVSSD